MIGLEFRRIALAQGLLRPAVPQSPPPDRELPWPTPTELACVTDKPAMVMERDQTA